MTARDRRQFLIGVLAAWLFTAAMLLATSAGSIATLAFPDVDDVLRLVEARDFLNGQSWFDVTQYRMNQPWGAPMHWSRLIDLPIAAVILLLRPFLAGPAAETAAAVIVPLLTLGLAMLLLALVAERLLGWRLALLACVLVSTCGPALGHLRPLRVDHHGWQIVFALGAVRALFCRDPRRSGALAGALLALWLQVSIEGLPMAAGIGAIVALHWAVDGSAANATRLRWFGLSLAATSLLLFAALHRPGQWPTIWCDAISPPHLAAIVAAGVGVTILTRLPFTRATVGRLAMLGLLGGLCLSAFHAIAPACGLDTFASLEPLVRKIWYENVQEGLPLWRQRPETAIGGIAFPLIGLAGAIVGFRYAEPDRRRHGLLFVPVLATACVIAVLVQRTASLANILAIPGAVLLTGLLLARAQASRRMLVRVLGSVLAVLALCPMTPALLWTMTIGGRDAEKTPPAPQAQSCGSTAYFRALDRLPPARILAGLEITPTLLFASHHGAVASSHHRNHVAMNDLLTAFTGSTEQAHAIIRRRQIRYVLLCPSLPEVSIYRRYAPHGFAARLVTGRPPSWLRPVPIPAFPGGGLWEVIG